MRPRTPGAFGAQLKAHREAAGFTQEELATIAGLSVHAVSALERGERRRPHVETVRALSAALDLPSPARDALLGSARTPAHTAAADELGGVPLPLAPTVLLGREADVQTLLHWLADPGARLITLTGPGGAGKTRLAVELARSIAEEGSSRVLFVALAAVRDPAFVAPAVAEALGLSDITGRDLAGRARAACDGRPTLLVVDNFEQVLDAAPLIAELLGSVASLRVLATSRAPLRLRGEREYAVRPLSLDVASNTESPADLLRAPAVRLFVERVLDVQPAFRLTSENGGAVIAICRRLDALPLALELAAPWIKVLSAESLLNRLDHDVLLSSVRPRDLPERQQTMNATVAWSYRLLDPGEQRAFRRFGVLPGPFSIDAAAAVLAGREGSSATSDEAVCAAAALIEKSLLLRAESPEPAAPPLYCMLETVRAYALLELTGAGERDDAFEGLVRHLTQEASFAAAGLVGPAQIEWLDRVRRDLESYRAALTWLIESGRHGEAAGIAWQLLFFWLIRGYAAEGLQWYEQIVNLRPLPPAAESRALVGAAAMWYMQGELARARNALTRALQLATDAGDADMIVHAELVSGHVDHADGQIEAAHDRFVRSAEGFRALSIPWGVGNSLSAMAAVTLAAGDAPQAEELLDQATSVLRDAGPWFLAVTLYVRAVLAVRRENPDGAIAAVRDSLAHIRDLQDALAFVSAMGPLAAAAVLKGEHAWAARILGARDAVVDRTGIRMVDSPVRDIREQPEREARARLGPGQWESAYAAGREASIDSLMNDIDRVLGHA